MKVAPWMCMAVAAASLMSVACERSPVPKPTAHAPEMKPQTVAEASTPQDQPAAVEPVHGGAIPQVPPLRQIVEAQPGAAIPIIVWDVSNDRNPAKIGWPKDTGNNKVFSMEGDFQFQLKVQDHEDFSGRVRQVESRRDGGLIDSVEITSLPQSSEDAYKNAKELFAKMHFSDADKAKLDLWLQKAQAGDYDNLEFHHTNSYNRQITIHVINDGNSEQPWSVDLDIDWSQVCGCHG